MKLGLNKFRGILKAIGAILKDALIEWDRENVPRLGAALAYYTLFALAPLLIVAIAVAGLVFGEEAARGEVVQQMNGLLGQSGAQTVEDMLLAARQPDRSIPATIIGIITLFLGATSAFATLQGALNQVFNVKPPKRGTVKGFIRGRLLSFGMVVGIGFLLLVSLALSAALAAAGEFMGSRLPGGETLWQVVNFVISFGFTTLLFAMVYKVLPDINLAWRDVWIGAAITSFFFTLGKFLIGLYLGHSSVNSAYGAAGSIVIILIWVYYSAQVILFGAEVTQAFTRRFGSVEQDRIARERSRPPEVQRI
jgi:membrane protein